MQCINTITSILGASMVCVKRQEWCTVYTGTCQPPLIFSDLDTGDHGQCDGEQSSDDNQAAEDPSEGIDIKHPKKKHIAFLCVS